jgi:hypothetical protein
LKHRAKHGEAVQFLEYAKHYDGDECLLWPFSTDRNGYGRVGVKCRNALAHRVVCEFWLGPPPFEKAEACHSCGVRNCVNGRHLRWDSHHENMLDSVFAGTNNIGERNGLNKLTRKQVREIRRLVQRGATYKGLARVYGVCNNTVKAIVQRKTWAWLS